MKLTYVFFASILAAAWWTSGAYKPVLIMHGILAAGSNMNDLAGFIRTAHPGTQLYIVDLYDFQDSLRQMWEQVDGVFKDVQAFIANSTDGFHMICYSQGGLVCRGMLESQKIENVETFISLSSPQGGQFGDSDYLNALFPIYTKDHIYEFFYTEIGQDVSVANYWRDPHHMDKYREFNEFLPFLNNGTAARGQGQNYKENFLNVKQLVLIGGPNDGVITPWQSSHFAFYDENEHVNTMQQQDYYVKDSFGLQTLDKAGKVKVFQVAGVEHTHWHGNKTVFDTCIEPYLT